MISKLLKASRNQKTYEFFSREDNEDGFDSIMFFKNEGEMLKHESTNA